MKSRYLFDSHALLTFFQDEKGALTVSEILKKTVDQKLDRLICLINLGEIIYITKRTFGDARKIEILARIKQLGFKVLPTSESIVFKAAEIKADYPISYAGCFAAACAIEESATIVTGDPEFKKVAHLIKIKWIR